MIKVCIVLICAANIKYKLKAYDKVDIADVAICTLCFIGLLTGWS